MRFQRFSRKEIVLVLMGALIQFSVPNATAETVDIENPDDSLVFNFYTSDGTPPNTVPVLVEARTEGFPEGVAKVEFAVDGDVVEGTWTGDALTAASAAANDPNDWSAVVDLLAGGAFSTRGTGISALVDLYAFATAGQYYTRASTTFDAMDMIDIDINVDLLSTIDADENGLPDADKLSDLVPPGGDPIILIVTTADGETFVVLLVSIADVLRGGVSTQEEEITIDLGNGNYLTATVVAPNLSTLQSELGGNTDVQGADNAVLAIALSKNAANLVDDGSDPVSEFDIEGADTPAGAFVSVDILLEDDGAGRGVSSTWTALTDPLVTPVNVEVLSNTLDSLTEAFAYYYGTTFAQSGIDLFINSAGTGWGEYDASGIVVNDNSDGFVFDMGELGVIVGFTSDAVTGGSNGGSCLIANAAFGTPLTEEIQSIRTMRDTLLLKNPLGQALASAYYKMSAPVSGNATLQAIVKGVLAPIIFVSNLLVVLPFAAPTAGLVLVAVVIRRRKSINR
jgi:hypothetical protein